MKMRPEINTYYTVTESHQQRPYQFRQQNYTNPPQQEHNLMQQQRSHHGSQTNQRHHHNPYSQYPNSSSHHTSSSITKESIRLCNPFDESSSASPSSSIPSLSNNNQSMMTSYMDRHSSTG